MGMWASPWTPAPTNATETGRARSAGAHRRMATPLTAAVRTAVMAPASRTARSSPVAASLSSNVAWMAGMPRVRFCGNPATHLMPSRSSAVPGPGPRSHAGMACANEASGRGWTPILAGRSASLTSARRVRSASRSCSGISGIAAATSAAHRYRIGARSVMCVGYDPGRGVVACATVGAVAETELTGRRAGPPPGDHRS